MAVNNPSKRYAKDLGVPVPNVRFTKSEFPRLNTGPAPYLPLRLHNERHDEYFVILTGKVVALDSLGFIVPAGLALQRELAVAAIGAAVSTVPTLSLYDATDVAEGVINARGVAAQAGEPVVWALMTNVAFPGGDPNLPAEANAITIGNHIGFAPYSMLRAGSDVISRSTSDNELHPAATGVDALTPYDPTQLRNLAWELQNRVTVLVADECLLYPVAADRSDVLIEGQAVAIGASMAVFELGGYVTYDENSDIVPASSSAVAMSNLGPDYGLDADADITDAILGMRQRLVGQVVRKNTRFPSSYLDKVKTRWESAIPGFNEIDRMPGSATNGYPWHMHTAGAWDSNTFGEVQISPLMR